MTVQTDKAPIDDNSEGLSESFYAKNSEFTSNNDLSEMDYSDFANLLTFAEEIEKSRDFYGDQLDKIYFFRDIVLIISLFLLIVFLTLVIANNDSIYGGTFLSSVVIIFIFYVFSLLLGVSFNSRVKKIKRKLRADQYALEEAIDLLREVEPILRHSRSKLQEIGFRIRLSRFEIGQKYEEPTSIFSKILQNLDSEKNDHSFKR